jgi:hypothetical protein
MELTVVRAEVVLPAVGLVVLVLLLAEVRPVPRAHDPVVVPAHPVRLVLVPVPWVVSSIAALSAVPRLVCS